MGAPDDLLGALDRLECRRPCAVVHADGLRGEVVGQEGGAAEALTSRVAVDWPDCARPRGGRSSGGDCGAGVGAAQFGKSNHLHG